MLDRVVLPLTETALTFIGRGVKPCLNLFCDALEAVFGHRR